MHSGNNLKLAFRRKAWVLALLAGGLPAFAGHSFFVNNASLVMAPIDPYAIPAPGDVVSNYAYDSPVAFSSNNNLFQLDHELIVLLSLDDNGDYGLSIFIDDIDDGSGGMLSCDITGLNGAALSVVDDPGENSSFDPIAGTAHFDWNWAACCTDGAAINLGPNPSGEICLTFSGIVGLSGFRFCGYEVDESNWREYTGLDLGAPLCLISIPDDGVVDAVEAPLSFNLHEAYPNPFNPNTTLSFTTQETGYASLRVFDLAGREVATLVNGLVEAGQHEFTFQAAGLASGIYIYRLESADAVISRRMVLLK